MARGGGGGSLVILSAAVFPLPPPEPPPGRPPHTRTGTHASSAQCTPDGSLFTTAVRTLLIGRRHAVRSLLTVFFFFVRARSFLKQKSRKRYNNIIVVLNTVFVRIAGRRYIALRRRDPLSILSLVVIVIGRAHDISSPIFE